MNESVTVNCKFHLARRRRRTELRDGEAEAPRKVAPKPIPRVSRLMALAIRFDRLVRDGAVINFAELAALGHVTRARLTQITNLLNLAPDIQEQILFLTKPDRGRDAITEKCLRPIAAVADWNKQRRTWRQLNPTCQGAR